MMLSVSLPLENSEALSSPILIPFALVGEFHVDLYTLPDALIKMLWDFTAERGAL